MKEVVIANPLRTANGSFGGAFKTVPAYDLAKIVMQRVIADAGIDPGQLDEVIFGNIGQPSEAANIARVAALYAGIPEHVPAYTVQRNCASSMQAITSRLPGHPGRRRRAVPGGRHREHEPDPLRDQGRALGPEAAPRRAHRRAVGRPDRSHLQPDHGRHGREPGRAVQRSPARSRTSTPCKSHKKAFMATRMGKFKDEIVPVEVVKKAAGQEVAKETITQDESINPGLTVQKAALYPTVFKKDGTVTPANACPMNDGAAAMLVTTAERAEKLGLKPMARILGYGYTGVSPAYMGIGPATALPKALARAGLKYDQLDLVELNEAFAAQSLAVGKQDDRRTATAGTGRRPTSTAAPSRWATRSASRARASSSPCCTR